jgi:hydrogenase maturation factor
MNTPETDSKAWSDHSEGILHEVVEASFARKLERERDELREKLNTNLTEISNKLVVAMKELDEAREVLREIAEASGFDNIGNWARNKANDALKNKN